jgi:Rrf2 family protein
MKLLNKGTDYAVRALLGLAVSRGELTTARELSAGQNIPYQFLRRILSKLIEEGYVSAKEGASGGVRLAVKPEKIGLMDVLRIFQGEIVLSECMFRKKMCANRATCVLRKRIKSIEQKVAGEFEGITLGTLLKDLGKQ